ncbi:hypothetical protein E1B28_003560 [Marasmius oreades]|uniref:F-box domain-containing protein n=1 Tax=Marasmius oreades TaxID=181124 RepID=A0A9P7RLV8_9AGAR|nr:uncharacterized protein E1B28_003560 [Marasmius oreades]KAG7086039.1 hypothetical protein E1B28_003560 [Marasmius oreades]
MPPPNLPPELWMKIFTQSVTSSFQDTLRSSFAVWEFSPGSFQWSSSPWEISRVCRNWRNIISAMPELWSSIEISSFAPGPNIVPFLDLYLKRSRGRGLDVVIMTDDSNNRSDHKDQHFLEAASFLMQHKARFQKLVMVIRFDDFPWGDYSLEHPVFPILESVCLGGDGELFPAPRQFWEGIRTAPKLHNVTLSYSLVLSTDNFLHILANSQVELLEIHNIFSLEDGFHSFRRLFPTLNKIETLKICDCTDAAMEAPFSPRLRNQALRALSIEQNDRPHEYLSSLELPSLETLLLSCIHLDSIFKAPPLHWVSDLFRILQRFPSLQRLSFHFNIEDEIRRQSNPARLVELLQFLPNLTALDARITGGGGSCSTNLLLALVSRSGLGRRLKSLRLNEADCHLDSDLILRHIMALETRVAKSKDPRDGNAIAQLSDVRLLFGFRPQRRSAEMTEFESLDRKMQLLELVGTKCALFRCFEKDFESSSFFVMGSKSLEDPAVHAFDRLHVSI